MPMMMMMMKGGRFRHWKLLAVAPSLASGMMGNSRLENNDEHVVFPAMLFGPWFSLLHFPSPGSFLL